MEEERLNYQVGFETRLQELEDKFAFQQVQQLNYPLDSVSRGVIERIIDDEVIDQFDDLIWDKIFYYSTQFESIDRNGNSASGGATVTIDVAAGLVLTTAATNGNAVRTLLGTDDINQLDFTKPSKFRVYVSFEVTTNQTAYIEACASPSVDNGAYGFKVINDTLYGLTRDDTVDTTISLQTISGGTIYKLEAKYKPSNSVEFYVDGVLKGKLSTGMPDVAETPESIYVFKLTANADAVKVMYLRSFEYLQVNKLSQR